MHRQMKTTIIKPSGHKQSTNENTLAHSHIKNMVSGKNVLYIATTYLDYLRVQQEIKILNLYAENVYIIVSKNKHYLLRLFYVYFRSLFFFNRVDVVFIGFAPQLVLPFLNWRFFGKKIIIDFFISLHDTMIMDRKKFSQTSLMSKVLKYFDKLTLKRADLIISDTLAHANYFVNVLGCDRKKITTLYLTADNNYYYHRSIEKPKKLKDKYIVLYFGSVLPLQGTNVILDAINLCKDKNIFYIMIGPLDSSHCINENVEFIKWLPQDMLSKYIAYSDLCLAGHFCADIEKAARTIPGKAYIYEAMGKMIVLGDNSANRERYPKNYTSVEFVRMGSSILLHKVITKSYLESTNEK